MYNESNGTLRSMIIRLRTQDIPRPRLLYTLYCQRTLLLIPGRVSDRGLWGYHNTPSSSRLLFRVAFMRTLFLVHFKLRNWRQMVMDDTTQFHTLESFQEFANDESPSLCKMCLSLPDRAAICVL